MNAARRRVGGLTTTLTLILIGLGRDSGQAQNRPPAPQSSAGRVARAVRVERAPRMDGTLNDPIWQQASPIKDFRQREPFEGQPATEPTEVRVLYTRNEVY